jgi:hypothetical protein
VINLTSGQSLYGKSVGGNIVYTISGTESGSRKILAQGFFGERDIYTAAGNSIIDYIYVHNNSSIDAVFWLYAIEPQSNNIIYKGDFPAGYSASLTQKGWTVYDDNGVPIETDGTPRITISDTAPSNPSLSDIWIDLSP